MASEVNQVISDEKVRTFTGASASPNGAWCWFQEPRAILDAQHPQGPMVLFTAISSAADQSSPEYGDLDLHWHHLPTGQSGVFELADRFESDDHDVAALWQRPDGRYLAMYARHGTDQVIRWRISQQPHDPSQWDAERTLTVNGRTTYNNLFYLPGDAGGRGRLYNFFRGVNWDPNILVSDDQGTTWRYAGHLFTEGNERVRPYVRYASEGRRVYFITTPQHPRDMETSIFSGYVQDGKLYDMAGAVLDANLLERQPTGARSVTTAALTPVFTTGAVIAGQKLQRAWTIDLKVDAGGQPVGIISVRAGDRPEDHRFLYVRFDGKAWQVAPLAKAGAWIYPPDNAAEPDYTGLAVVDPHRADTVYISTSIDPRRGQATPYYEIYRGVTSDGGRSWSWTALTENSATHNLRPQLPLGELPSEGTLLLWMRGKYMTYLRWETQAVGMRLK